MDENLARMPPMSARPGMQPVMTRAISHAIANATAKPDTKVHLRRNAWDGVGGVARGASGNTQGVLLIHGVPNMWGTLVIAAALSYSPTH